MRFGHPRGGGRARVNLRSILLCDWRQLRGGAGLSLSLVSSGMLRVELLVDQIAVPADVFLGGL